LNSKVYTKKSRAYSFRDKFVISAVVGVQVCQREGAEFNILYWVGFFPIGEALPSAPLN